MEALYPGCTTKTSKTTQPLGVTDKNHDQKYHKRQNVYSSTATTDTVSPILPEQNSKLYCVSSHNQRCGTMPLCVRSSPQHPQASFLHSQQFTGYTDMPSHTNISSPQYLQTPSVFPQQLPGYAGSSSHSNIPSPQHLRIPSIYSYQFPGYPAT